MYKYLRHGCSEGTGPVNNSATVWTLKSSSVSIVLNPTLKGHQFFVEAGVWVGASFGTDVHHWWSEKLVMIVKEINNVPHYAKCKDAKSCSHKHKWMVKAEGYWVHSVWILVNRLSVRVLNTRSVSRLISTVFTAYITRLWDTLNSFATW